MLKNQTLAASLEPSGDMASGVRPKMRLALILQVLLASVAVLLAAFLVTGLVKHSLVRCCSASLWIWK